MAPDCVRDEAGFGLMELVIALVFLSVALMTLVSSFGSAAIATKRAGAISTAGVIADSQMERYRAMTYDWIGLDTGVATDGTYTADVACVGVGCGNIPPSVTGGAAACRSGGVVVTNTGFGPNCLPTQTITGPDGRAYRLDSYVTAIQTVPVGGGNQRSTKLVVVVVRDTAAGNRVLAREESDFDYCTSLPDPSGTGALCS
jgi:type II secretory pathway pseudopilin PulG